ncbi:hypothetical protein HDU98_011240 [Podochytrium sp. JEL0797]|nr:hypothetical protein HDU98_011240 [Podochytrium sp. JEL0797]
MLASILILLATEAAAFDWTLLGPGNAYTSLITTLTVPPVPAKPATGDATYFYWPGLQTNTAATNYNPIGFGVLQPVLTFGPACTPNQPAGVSVYRGWHVSAQYVNPSGTVAGHTGCLGGNMMDVQPGDNLVMSMVLQGTVWVQTVTRQGVACSGPGSGVSAAGGCQVTYSIDMQGQAQNRAELVLELYYQAVITSNVVFSGISMTILNKEPVSSLRFCTPSSRLQATETCTGMLLSADGKTCTIQQCLFTAPAIPVAPAPVSNASSGLDGNGTPINPAAVIPALPPADTSTSPVDTSPPSSLSNGGSTGGSEPLVNVGPVTSPSSGATSTTSTTSNSNWLTSAISSLTPSVSTTNGPSSTTGNTSLTGSTVTGSTVSGSTISPGNGSVVEAVAPAAASAPPASSSKSVIYGVVGAAAVALVIGGLVFMRMRAKKAAPAMTVHEFASDPAKDATWNGTPPPPAPLTASNEDKIKMYNTMPVAYPLIQERPTSNVFIPPRSQLRSATSDESLESFSGSTVVGDSSRAMELSSSNGVGVVNIPQRSDIGRAMRRVDADASATGRPLSTVSPHLLAPRPLSHVAGPHASSNSRRASSSERRRSVTAGVSERGSSRKGSHSGVTEE